jgi:hypothetical protein
MDIDLARLESQSDHVICTWVLQLRDFLLGSSTYSINLTYSCNMGKNNRGKKQTVSYEL